MGASDSLTSSVADSSTSNAADSSILMAITVKNQSDGVRQEKLRCQGSETKCSSFLFQVLQILLLLQSGHQFMLKSYGGEWVVKKELRKLIDGVNACIDSLFALICKKALSFHLHLKMLIENLLMVRIQYLLRFFGCF
ncbi:hypothetical protein MKX01_041209 [Papaver californicum]|nr:hypothetical protein MKX01_041209 [Papaver californicum]